jgi:hydrogenase/urease accessory protein HupE
MRFCTAAFAVLAIAVSGAPAYAHDFVSGPGFWNGFLHPLLVPAHALTVLAFGLMTGQQDKASRTVLMTLFPLAVIAGIPMIIFGTFRVDLVPAILLGCGATAGLLTALARPLPRIVAAAPLVVGGPALMVDSVPSVVSKSDTILALAGTALAATLALGLVAYAALSLTRDWQRIGVRIVGSWTAASALLVLALQFAK